MGTRFKVFLLCLASLMVSATARADLTTVLSVAIPKSNPIKNANPELTANASLSQPSQPFSGGQRYQKECLAIAMYFEARSEGLRGQVAVAQVIFNRIKSRLYPNNICDVVWQDAGNLNACQFSFTCDGLSDIPQEKKPWRDAQELATFLLDEKDCPDLSCIANGGFLTPSTLLSTHYHAEYVEPYWGKHLERVSKVGKHLFYVSPRVQRAARLERSKLSGSANKEFR